MIEVLNLGAGVQSSTVLLMSIRGELPRLDHAIFADTGWEPAAVYRQMDWLEEQATAAGIAVHRVSAGNIKHDALISQVRGTKQAGRRWASMPYYTDEHGQAGMIRRQCTSEYKIQAVERCIRRTILKLKPRQRAPQEPVIRRWYGISFDEQQRTRISGDKWAVNWYPLIEKCMSRAGCHEWLESHGYPDAPRSACIGCPYHSDAEWRDMKENRPEEWADAVAFDAAIRNCSGMRSQVFLHRDRIPLDEVNLYKKFDKNQLPLFSMQDECSGMCGV